MPPIERRRRRLRRLRRLRRPVVVGVAAGVALLLVIGGALHEGRASQPYWRDLDRSYALQATVTVDESNTQGAALGALMGSITRLSRPSLQVQLDDLVSASAASAVDADAMSTPAPADAVGVAVATALAQRATAMADLRAAVDGLLQMVALPVPGSATTTSAPGPGPPWSAGRATSAMAAVGRLLVSADRSYAAARRRLAAAPGHPRLPRSVWVAAPSAWSGPAVAGLVAALTSAGSSLAPVRQLCVLVVDLNPAALPPAGASTTQPPPRRSSGGGCPAPPPAEGVATVPPTSDLGVTVVVGNVGTVAQATVVGATLQPANGGPPSSASRRVTLAPGTSTAVDLPPLRVSTGRYALRVALGAAASQSDPAGAAAGPYQIAVAPPTPPSTTTTTTGAPRTSHRPKAPSSSGTTATT
ncbi:MAG: hypothetical protein ACYCU7_12575 [Acidimicrobiales bacterium]